MTTTNAYTTNAQMKAISQIGSASDDIIVDLAINGASRMIDGYCGWRFWQDPAVVARTFDATSWVDLWLTDEPEGDGISTATGLIVKLDQDADGVFETTLTIGTDFTLLPRNAAARVPAWPYTQIRMTSTYALPRLTYGHPGVQVTAKWGWPTVPDDVTTACVLLARDLYKEMKSAPFGIADFGGDGAIGAVRIGANRTAKSLLESYKKPAVG